MGKRKVTYYVQLVLFSLCTSLALTMRFEPMEECGFVLKNIYPEIVHGFKGTSWESTCFTFLLVIVNKEIDKIRKEQYKYLTILGCLLGFLCLAGESYSVNNSLNPLVGSYIQVFKAIIYFVGMSYLFFRIGILLDLLFDGEWECISFSKEGLQKKLNIYRKHPFGTVWVYLLLIVLPQVVLSYPARMSYDARFQLAQYFGLEQFTSHHPPVSTVLMGKIVSMGLKCGSGNLGYFAYIFLQYLIYTLVTAYLVYTIRVHLHAPAWLQIVTIFVFSFSPYHAAYVGQMLKDIIYSYAFLLFVIEVFFFLYKEYAWDNRHRISMVFAASGTVLFRNNGKYIIYPMLFILLLVTCKRLRKAKEDTEGKRNLISLCCVFACVVVICNSLTGYVESRYAVQRGSVREVLSLPFQQTARYVKMYGIEMPDDEKEVIEGVLDFEAIGINYDPLLSDPVKATYKETASRDDLIAYFEIWVKHFLRHPMTYVDAVLNQNYRLFWPKAEIYSFFTETIYEEYAPSVELANYLHICEVNNPFFCIFSSIQELYTGVWQSIPVLGWTANLAIYNILLILLIYFAARSHCKITLLLMIPAILNEMIIVASPYVSPRYSLPTMYMMPLLVSLFVFEKRNNTYEQYSFA